MTGPRRGSDRRLVARSIPEVASKANPLARAVRPGVPFLLSGPSTLARIAGRESSWVEIYLSECFTDVPSVNLSIASFTR
jgi:hypothetical protein